MKRNIKKIFLKKNISVLSLILFIFTNLTSSLYASDTTQNWTFASSSDYTLSDSSLIEVSTNTARLKVRNYSSDSNTSALFHFDESSGNPADGSSNSNTATASNLTYGTGNLNNAGDFNGTSSRVKVTDSSSLSLVQGNTLEAWTKFDSSFSAGSHEQKQVIMDKGVYQLYYDNQTGKISYELAPSNADSWSQAAGGNATTQEGVSGSWDLNGKLAIESMTTIGTDVYVGLGTGASDGEVWKWNGTIWSQIGGDGVNSSWASNTYEEIYSMTNDGTNLYIGAGSTAGDGDVWKWTGSAWTQIGGDALNSGWAASTYEYVTSLTYFNSTLYAGLGSSANDAEVWSWNGSAWTKIGGDSVNSGWTTNFEYVASLIGTGTTLYAGLASTAGDAEVWRFSSGSWTRIGGDAINSSWADATYEAVSTMLLDGNYLYAGIGNSAAGEAEVWRCDTTASCTTWTKIGGDAVNTSWADSTFEQVWALTSDGTNIYAGIGNTAGDNEVWRWNGSAWTQIGGDALNSGFTNTHTQVRTLSYISSTSTLWAGLQGAATSAEVWSFASSTWTRRGGNYVNSSWGFTNIGSAENMVTAGGKLYVGNGNATAGNANVWEYDNSTWTRVGGQGLNSSWTANTYESITSMVRYNNELYVGLGTGANDAEVWRYSGGSWTQIGGDSLNSGWTTNYDSVFSMTVYNGNLIVGLGITATEGEVWSWNGSAWTKIGGDGVNSGWATAGNIETIRSMTVYDGNLYVGLGDTAGDADVWRYNGSTWTQVGGDALNSSWASATFEVVDSLAVYNGYLYAGLGTTAGDADVWQYDGSSWSQVGGDALNSSWTAATYERVRALTVFNGELYAGLGSTAGDGEVWKYNSSTWSQIGGDSLNNGWASAHEHVTSFSVYRGKLYAGLGHTANTDAAIYAYGGNTILDSVATSQNTSWHHVAATYDGTTMKIYIDGVLNNSASASLSMLDTTAPLMIGSSLGSGSDGRVVGNFTGLIDEVRISNTARSSFTTTPYSNAVQTVKPTTPVYTSGITNFDQFSTSESLNGGAITYRLSADGGTTWKYWSGGWVTSSSTSEANSASTINTNISSFTVGTGGLVWQAILLGDGTQQVTLSSVTVGAIGDSTAPTNPSSLTALSASAGSSITTNTWYSHTAPYFSWSGGSDGGSGIAGYYVYFGTNSSADPAVDGTLQAGTTYTASSLVSGSTYYLRIKTKDNAQNVSASAWAAFIYKFDSTAPTNPPTINVDPAGYSADNSFTFSWSAGSDGGSGVAGYQYKTGASSGLLSNWSSTTTSTSIDISDAAYQADANTFYLRTVDTAGNTSSAIQVSYYYAGDGPSAPQNLSVNPSSNTENSFAFSWQAPSSYSGSVSDLTYCYTVNTLPSSSTCNYTSAGATSLSASSFATQTGLNVFYLASKNGSAVGGAINYGAYASVSFTANTSAPGAPLNLDIADVSVKSTSAWKLAISWSAPSDSGSGVSNYQIYRSEDDSTYTSIATTTGTAYVDSNLEQETYYYKVRACDSVNNCGIFTSSVDLYPDGKYDSAPSLSTGPTVSGITTRKAIISWTTDRASDTKIQYGLSSGNYFSTESGNSTQTAAHTITLTNLTPGTTYYFKAKWTDEDGNVGSSTEKSFTTVSAPFVSSVKFQNVSINKALVSFSLKDATKANVQYGKTNSYGSTETLSTSTAESTYTVQLEDLTDATQYHLRVVAEDDEGNTYNGDDYTFETLPVPKIANVRMQQVVGMPTATLRLIWASNTPLSTIVSYYPTANPAAAKDYFAAALKLSHEVVLRDLRDDTEYAIVIKGKDTAGNEPAVFTKTVRTALDFRPPEISNLSVETTIIGVGEAARAQILVSWDTDEPAATQVEWAEGTGGSYNQSSQEDLTLTTNHVVTIPSLLPAKIYHLRVISKDKANNKGESADTVVITPKSTRDALNLVIDNLSKTFGFLRQIPNR